MKPSIVSGSRHLYLLTDPRHSTVSSPSFAVNRRIVPFPQASRSSPRYIHSDAEANWEDVTFAALGACAAGSVVLALLG